MIIIVILLGLLITLIPLANPRFMIITAALIWPIVYGLTYFFSQGFDSTQHLPWYVADPNRATAFLIFFVGMLGILRGIPGIAGMLAVWVPIFLMPAWLLHLGVAVEHSSGWSGYVFDNYQDKCSNRRQSYVCEYYPLNDQPLPTFVQDESIGQERIMAVRPYNGPNSKVSPTQNSNFVEVSSGVYQSISYEDNCKTVIIKTEKSESKTNECVSAQ